MPFSFVPDLLRKSLSNSEGGRLSLGAQRAALEDLIPSQFRQLSNAQYESAQALQTSMTARLESREAATALLAHAKQADQGRMLPALQQSIKETAAHMQAKVQEAVNTTRAYR